MWSQYITHATINCRKEKSQPLSLGESLHQANRGKNEGSHQIFKRGCLANVSLNCPVLLKNITKTLDPRNFFFFRLTNIHSAKSHTVMKNSSTSERHLAVAKPCVPLKQNNKEKKKIICLLFCADVCLADEPPLPMIWSSKAQRGLMCWLTDNRPKQHNV